jgi:hypothetical protein
MVGAARAAGGLLACNRFDFRDHLGIAQHPHGSV